VAEAETPFQQAMQIRVALHDADPENAEVAAGYAWSLVSVRRIQEAARLFEWVLERVPQHLQATQMRTCIASVRGKKAAPSPTRADPGTSRRGWARVKRFLSWGG
jgi:thioredoxin-like negative regulator of GroEL